MMKVWRTLAVALGLTMICMAWLLEPLGRSTHLPVYHWSGSASMLFGPIAVDTAVLWVMLTLFLLSARRPGRWRIAVWVAILVCLPWLVLRNVHRLAGYAVPHWIFGAAAVWVLAVLLWRPAWAKYSDPLIEFTSTLLAFVALTAIYFLSAFSWSWWQARGLNRPPPPHQRTIAKAAANRPRVLWILLDELSYQQVYEHRYPGLALPTFDALASQATVFTHVVPAGKSTEMVLPALLTGIPVDALRATAQEWPVIHDAASAKWERFDEHNTVFQDAKDEGYGTAVAGWFNPYCRMMPTVLDRCHWADDDTVEDGLPANGTFRSNLIEITDPVEPVHSFLSRVLGVSSRHESEPDLHLLDYQNLYAAGDRLLLDPDATFVLLHLPIPHPLGIYNRATGQLTTTPSAYVDNLALADRYLAHVKSVLEQNGEWDSSTVVIMGDHSWRTTFLWENIAGWTKEDEQASDGGKFDDRPGYIVKLAGQTKGAKIDEPFHAVETRALLDELLAGKIRSSDDLASWVRQNPGR